MGVRQARCRVQCALNSKLRIHQGRPLEVDSMCRHGCAHTSLKLFCMTGIGMWLGRCTCLCEAAGKRVLELMAATLDGIPPYVSLDHLWSP